MASIINADTSGGLKTTADTSGVLQLQSGGTTIATISSTGLSTQVGSPAFRAYKNSPSTQAITSSTYTKVTFDTESFDTNNNFASSTFTPTAAGYYQLNCYLQFDGFTGSTSYQGVLEIRKNGSSFSFSNVGAGTTLYPVVSITDIVYANGSTDYFEIYFYQNSGSGKNIYGGNAPAYCYFSGAMVRSA